MLARILARQRRSLQASDPPAPTVDVIPTAADEPRLPDIATALDCRLTIALGNFIVAMVRSYPGRCAMNRPELLLVDDDPIAIEMLSHMLASFARLRFARTGPDALRLVREHCPDLMLLDAEMPGMGGIEVLQALRADAASSRLPVIVITSHRSAVLEASVFDNGAVDFLPKPLSAQQVIARVQAQLRIQRIARLADRMPPAFPAKSSASLLVVDDDLNAIQTLQSVLAPLVGQIRFATDGRQALNLIEHDPPDLILLDVQMPGMNGFDVCRALQADPVLRQIPSSMLLPSPSPATLQPQPQPQPQHASHNPG